MAKDGTVFIHSVLDNKTLAADSQISSGDELCVVGGNRDDLKVGGGGDIEVFK